MIVDKLEIFILTYNRASKLDRTLQMLSSSSLKGLKITIMNNASTDGTLSVCEKYKEEFSTLSIITNPYNIGASANYLRALENSTSIYTWILCDDDIFDFSSLSQLLELIEEEKADLFFVGGHENKKWIDRAGLYSPMELIQLGFSFFTFASFWPCSIFKTNDFLSLLREAYNYIPDSYVNMPLIFQYYLLNKKLYVHSSKIVLAQYGQFYNTDTFIYWWVKTSWHLETKYKRLLCFEEQCFPNATRLRRLCCFSSLWQQKIISTKTYSLVKNIYEIHNSFFWWGINLIVKTRNLYKDICK